MVIGLISDTHGDKERTISACKALLAEDVEAVLHCGDIGTEEILFELVAQFSPGDIPVHAVLGNCDLSNDALPAFPENTGVKVWGRLAELEIGGKRIALMHGDDWQTMEKLVLDGKQDYIFSGHTHEASDHTAGSTRLINPGAVYRASPPTVATLDLETGKLTSIEFMAG